MRLITAIHLHHSAGSELDSPEAVAQFAVARGVGITHDPYHFHIWRPADSLAAEGVNLWVVSAGRNLEEIPASDHGHNTGAIAVCVHGNYHLTPLPLFALTRLAGCVAELCQRFGLGVEAIRGHRELPGAATLCPGYDPDVVRDLVRAML